MLRMQLCLTEQFIRIRMCLFHLLSCIFWLRFTLNCETIKKKKKPTSKTGTTHFRLRYDSVLLGFLGVNTKPEVGGAKWGLLIFPFMDMQ